MIELSVRIMVANGGSKPSTAAQYVHSISTILHYNIFTEKNVVPCYYVCI